MTDRKRNNLLRELKTCFIKDKYEVLVTEKVDWIRSLEIKIILVSASGVIEMEKIRYGGKVTWEKGANPKKAISLWINILDYRDIEFMIVFLHECGHIMDKDNSSIELETTESEISAWNHAIADFIRLKPDQFEKAIFSEKLKNSLLSYKVDKSIVEKMISKIM